MAELGNKVGDTSYLKRMGFDTSYLDRYNDLTLQEKQASLLKKKASGRSSGGGRYSPTDEELDRKLGGTPGNSKVTTTRKQGTVIGYGNPNPSQILTASRNNGFNNKGNTWWRV